MKFKAFVTKNHIQVHRFVEKTKDVEPMRFNNLTDARCYFFHDYMTMCKFVARKVARENIRYNIALDFGTLANVYEHLINTIKDHTILELRIMVAELELTLDEN